MNELTRDDVNKAEEIGAISFEIAMKVKAMISSLDFYRRRVRAFQVWQKELSEPYRTEACNIIANGISRTPGSDPAGEKLNALYDRLLRWYYYDEQASESAIQEVEAEIRSEKAQDKYG